MVVNTFVITKYFVLSIPKLQRWTFLITYSNISTKFIKQTPQNQYLA